MTVGKDVSSLFTDVLNCMQTENLELKKLVYLYLINYAKSQPDLAILAVNTFVKVTLSSISLILLFLGISLAVIFNLSLCIPQDSQDPNPLIRALAVRTMGCIRVDKITEYLCDPLQKCLKVEPLSYLATGTCINMFKILMKYYVFYSFLPSSFFSG